MRKKTIYERGDYYATGASDLELAKEELDRFNERRETFHKFCSACGQAVSGEINDEWVKKFRKRASGPDIASPAGKIGIRSPTTVAASVSIVRTAINQAFESRKLLHRAAISVKRAEIEGKPPWFRAS